MLVGGFLCPALSGNEARTTIGGGVVGPAVYAGRDPCHELCNKCDEFACPVVLRYDRWERLVKPRPSFRRLVGALIAVPLPFFDFALGDRLFRRVTFNPADAY